jgi:hypothetical protein
MENIIPGIETRVIEDCPLCRVPLDINSRGTTSEGFPSIRSSCSSCGQQITSIIPNRSETE